MNKKNLLVAAAILWALSSALSSRAQAEEVIEKAGVATGVTAGNAIAMPLKAVTMVIGAFSGVLSFIVTGGDTEVTRQVWRDTSEGPYLITPELARMAVGKRPELEAIK